MTFNMTALQAQLKLDEGVRRTVYIDTMGHRTIGVGRNLDANPLPAGMKPPLTDEQIDDLLQQDIAAVVRSLNNHLLWWQQLDDPRQRVMIDLAFNMGIGTLQTFTTFLHYMRTDNYDMAAKDLLTTEWAKQVGTRAGRVVALLKS